MKQILLIIIIAFNFQYAIASVKPIPYPVDVTQPTDVFGEPNFKMNYYPNPVGKNINIEINFDKVGTSQVEIHFRNLIGKEMISAFITETNNINPKFEIDLSDLPSGIYLMEIVTFNNGNAAKITKRITKI
ncbi:MAG: T9SS type A sorting domain-containing protein [Bacteroidota bacterium]|nr:T9SS type A sorting domain-containing protein [Bacteroidota bacterium]